MGTNSPLADVEVWPSKPECRMPSWGVRMSTATYRKAHASQSEYFGVVSSVGSEVRQVVIHLISLGYLTPMGAGRKRAFMRYATSPDVRWLGGVPKPGGAEGSEIGGSNQGIMVTGFSEMKSNLQRRTSLRRICTSNVT
jgi:hypothetical protein